MPPKITISQLTKRFDEWEQKYEAQFKECKSRIKALEKQLKSMGKPVPKNSKADDGKKEKKRKRDESPEQKVVPTIPSKREKGDSASGTPMKNGVDVAASAKKARVENTAKSEPDSVAQAPTQTAPAEQVVVKDPDAEHRCYDVLGISPSASPEDVRRAFKRRALKAHPDKEGGSQAAFLCLNLAYELISDETRRAKYNYELMQLKSKDGQAFKAEGDDAPVLGLFEQQSTAANPEMLCEAFCSFQERAWPPLIKLLTEENLCVLVRHLQSGAAEEPPKPEQSGSKEVSSTEGKGTVPGLIRTNRRNSSAPANYQGKIVCQNVGLRSYSTNLDDALEARMALGAAKNTIAKLMEEGQSFDDAFRAGIVDLRGKDQSSCFHILFSFEIQFGTRASKGKRLTTPQVPDAEQLLEQRRILLDIRERNAPEAEAVKAHANMMAESKQVKARLNANKKGMRYMLLGDARLELKRRGHELPEGALPPGPAARSRRPTIEVKQFKVIGPNRVGVLSAPDPSLAAIAYMQSGAIFDVSMVHISNGLKFFQLSDGCGWIPQCSRKDKTRIVVEQCDAEFDRPAIMDDDEKGSDPEDSSSDSSSSSSSSDS